MGCEVASPREAGFCEVASPSQIRRCSRFLLHSKPGAANMPYDENIERIPINQLHQETGAHELATSPDMEPYLEFAMAIMQDADPKAELEAIRHLPLEKRYIWRVASALKWGFADFDDLGVEADRRT